MDVPTFINLVYGYKCLWDQSDSTYLLRDHQSNAWREISKEIGVPVPDLKRKWRGLRDTFVKELRKLNLSSHESSIKPESKWGYFKHLLFLYSTITNKDLNNLNVECVGQSGDQNKKETKRKRHKRHSLNDIDKELLEKEHEKFKFYLHNVNDADAQFLMSLLPFLKEIPKHRKLMVRTKLQEVLMNEANEMSSAVKSDDDSSDSSE